MEVATVIPRNSVHGRLPGSGRLFGTLQYEGETLAPVVWQKHESDLGEGALSIHEDKTSTSVLTCKLAHALDSTHVMSILITMA